MNCRRLAIAFLTLGLFSSACLTSSENASDDVEPTGDGVVDDGDATGTDDGAGTTDQADDDATDADSDDDSADGGPDDIIVSTPGTTKPRLTPGPCGVDQLPRQSIYAVSNIPDDDPDGRLNVRGYEGRKIATLPEGAAVYVPDAKSSTTADSRRTSGQNEVEGQVNSAFLDETSTLGADRRRERVRRCRADTARCAGAGELEHGRRRIRPVGH